MNGFEALRIAADALRANLLRSVLTTLGIVIGIAAVVTLVGVGTGAKVEITSQVEGLGSNLLLVVPGDFGSSGPQAASSMTLDDVRTVEEVVGDPDRVTTVLTAGQRMTAAGTRVAVTLQGTTATYPDVFSQPLARGGYFSRADEDSRRRVVVLGSQAAEQAFPSQDPIGRRVTIGGVELRVIGVFEPFGEAFGVTRDVEAHVPVAVAQRILGSDRISGLAVKAPDRAAIPALQGDLVAALQEAHPDDDFSAVTQGQILGLAGRVLDLLTLVLAAIAAISLLVGGVGVSNIMLVSVRERTREIGLRKALGARQRDVLLQFLLEAVLLTAIGGLVGVGLGVGATELIDLLTPLPAVVAWWSPPLAFAVSAAVGIFFGVVPARRAGRLDPVVALRAD